MSTPAAPPPEGTVEQAEARFDERWQLLEELGADPSSNTQPTREDVKKHVRWLEKRAKAGSS